MADDAARSRLGRGLAALIGDVGAESQVDRPRARSQRKVPIEFVRANPRNPRKLFSDAELTELADSIRERGIIQPIVVRARGADNFEIIAGERRWRAAQRAGLHEVPIVVLDVSDGEALELAIIENVQRTDLNPLEEATGYQVARRRVQSLAGRHRQDRRQEPQPCRQHAAAAASCRTRVKAYINAGKLTAGHARALINQPESRSSWRDEIVEQGLNVRQVEALARRSGRGQAARRTARGRARQGRRHAWRWRSGCPMRSACWSASIIAATAAACCSVRYRTLEQLDDVVRRLEVRAGD